MAGNAGGGGEGQENGRLSPAETKVAKLVIDGLSNREIAERLFLSVNTVESHLRHAYKKLGVRSRTQLAMKLTTRRDSVEEA